MKNQKIFKNFINGYIALTDFTKNFFIDFGYNKEKFYIKDNGSIDNNIRRKKSGGYFLYLGRISIEKGVFFLLDFFKEFNEYKLIVAGTSRELDTIKKKYNYPNIVFKGFVDGETKKILIQETQALILPSLWYENYPVSIVEVFCCGIPVIGSNIGGIPYIIEDGKNGLLFEPGNKDSLKEKIDKIHNDELRDRLGDNARQTFLNRMKMINTIKVLEKIYKEVINEK